MAGNRTIALNTLINYFRIGSIVLLSIFSTKYIYNALGEIDFGVYNVIAGVVLLFTFISNVLSSATQRYLSLSIGQGKETIIISKLLYNFIILHVAIAIILAIIIQLGGMLIIHYLLNIPVDKIADAYFVLITVTVGLIGSILIAPFEAILISRENILYLSISQFIIAVLRFVIAIIVLYAPINHLRLYAVLIAILPFIQLLIIWCYCYKQYPETKIKFEKIQDFALFKEIGSYVGWVIIGSGCGTIRQQGIGVVLNMFYGVLMNTANGIAMQINSVILQYSSSIAFSLRPQLIQSVGRRDNDRFRELTYASCKFSLLLTGLVVAPIIISMPHLLSLWLGKYPDYTVTFCRLLLISALIMNSSLGLTSSLEAIGKVKTIHLTVGFSHLIPMILGYVFLRNGYPAPCIYWLIIVVELYATIMRMYFVKHYLSFSIREYIKQVWMKTGGCIGVYCICIYLLWHYCNFHTGILSWILFLTISCVCFLAFSYCIALNTTQRQIVINKTSQLLHIIRRNG